LAVVDALSHDGRGIAHIEGKTVFLDGGLPGETVSFIYNKRRTKFDEGTVLTVTQGSPDREVPKCVYFGTCGGCALQHLRPLAQIQHKQSVLIEQLRHFGQVVPETVLEPLESVSMGYRRKARLGVRFVTKKNKVLIGFREKRSHFLLDMDTCEVLDPKISQIIPALKLFIATLEALKSIPQIEVAVGDTEAALVFRHMEPLSESDKAKFIAFGMEHDLHIYLQSAGIDSIQAIYPKAVNRLSYQLPAFGLTFLFHPTDFTQVNFDINKKMVSRAIALLALKSTDRVLDLFCGLGNFTLAMATLAKEVVGVEGSEYLCKRAEDNALHNKLTNVKFYAADLYKLEEAPWTQEHYDAVLIDPPRTGALPVMDLISQLGVSKVVYVSCNPATLARDVGVLVHQHGFRLMTSGVMDMFPHTTHVESIALLIK
jgi:23S rRNA (uracil1939-C5)-methyltransferase